MIAINAIHAEPNGKANHMVINGDIPNEAGAEIDAAKKYLAEQRHG